MRHCNKVLRAAGLWLATWLANAHADTYEVGFYNYPPMMIESTKSGIYQDIFDELGRLTGEHFHITYYPYPRITLLFNRGELDIEPGVYPGWVQQQKIPGLFSRPFARVVDALVFSQGKSFPVKSPDDLRGSTIGLVRGYSYPDLQALFAQGLLERRDGVSEEQLLQMLAAKRFDQILINKAVAQYHIARTAAYRDLEIGDVLGSVAVSMRLQPKHAALLPRLNEALVKMQQAGTLEKIQDKYGVHL